MALKIENFKIAGKPNHLQKKLDGEIPVDRLELLYLVNSWGRANVVYLNFKNNISIKIDKCSANECYELNKLDVSQITNMEDLFASSLFNGSISSWDVSKVTDMNSMFYSAENFNQSLNSWNTSNVTNMSCMFYLAEKFNGDIGKWDVSNVTDMGRMFSFSKKFNQDISKWDVSNVENMNFMFAETKVFNQNISSWNLDKVDSCKYMLLNTEAFINKYNNGEILPNNSNELKKWFNENRENMNAIDLKEKHGDEIDNFFNIISNTKKIIF